MEIYNGNTVGWFKLIYSFDYYSKKLTTEVGLYKIYLHGGVFIMKILEFIQVVNNNKAKLYNKADKNALQNFIKQTLNIKSYISIKEKKQLVEDIVSETIIYENGLLKFNGIDQYIVYAMKCIEAYTDLELSDDIENDYDELSKVGLLEPITSTFSEEYKTVLTLLQMQCDYILMDNSISSKVGVFLTRMSSIIDKLANSLTNSVDNFDISKLNIDKKDIEKITEFLQIVGW